MGLFSRLFPRKPPEAAAKLSRNEPCWCGSGKKYKLCHQSEDQRYFTNHQKIVCNGPT